MNICELQPLDTFIIEELKKIEQLKREQERDNQRPRLELPLYDDHKPLEDVEEEESSSTVIHIQLYGINSKNLYLN